MTHEVLHRHLFSHLAEFRLLVLEDPNRTQLQRNLLGSLIELLILFFDFFILAIDHVTLLLHLALQRLHRLFEARVPSPDQTSVKRDLQ